MAVAISGIGAVWGVRAWLASCWNTASASVGPEMWAMPQVSRTIDTACAWFDYRGRPLPERTDFWGVRRAVRLELVDERVDEKRMKRDLSAFLDRYADVLRPEVRFRAEAARQEVGAAGIGHQPDLGDVP